MTTEEDRRLVAALTTEVCEQRAALVGLVAELDIVCDMFQKDPYKMPAYVEAKRLLA